MSGIEFETQWLHRYWYWQYFWEHQYWILITLVKPENNDQPKVALSLTLQIKSWLCNKLIFYPNLFFKHSFSLVFCSLEALSFHLKPLPGRINLRNNIRASDDVPCLSLTVTCVYGNITRDSPSNSLHNTSLTLWLL